MPKYTPKPHEEIFDVHPVGVKYKCELCEQGEMIAISHKIINLGDPNATPMFEHKCTACNGTMMLPQIYPKIEWEVVE